MDFLLTLCVFLSTPLPLSNTEAPRDQADWPRGHFVEMSKQEPGYLFGKRRHASWSAPTFLASCSHEPVSDFLSFPFPPRHGTQLQMWFRSRSLGCVLWAIVL